MFLDAPRGFRNPTLVEQRQQMLSTVPKVRELQAWAEDLAVRRGATVAQFDPAETGVESRVLLLLEAPGPMTNEGNRRPGSGFISVDNNDLTAANVWRTRNEVGLHRGILAWNIVPWYLGPASKKPNVTELREGAAELLGLLELLPNLDTVVVSGRYAQNGWDRYVAPRLDGKLRVIETWHPSPLSLNNLARREHFTEALRVAAA